MLELPQGLVVLAGPIFNGTTTTNSLLRKCWIAGTQDHDLIADHGATGRQTEADLADHDDFATAMKGMINANAQVAAVPSRKRPSSGSGFASRHPDDGDHHPESNRTGVLGPAPDRAALARTCAWWSCSVCCAGLHQLRGAHHHPTASVHVRFAYREWRTCRWCRAGCQECRKIGTAAA